MKSSWIAKSIAFDGKVRIIFMDNTHLLQEIFNRRTMNLVLKEALGRTVSAAGLIAGILKDPQQMSLKIKTSSPGLNIFADAEASGNIRGYLSEKWFQLPSDGLSLEQIIGSRGTMQVVQETGMKRMFTGITDMPYANITDDISHYYGQSEQTPTWVTLNLCIDHQKQLVTSSRGILAQLLPGGDPALMKQVKETVDRCDFMLSRHQQHETHHELLLNPLGGGAILETKPLQWFCECSKEMLSGLLLSLDREELANLVLQAEPAEVVCSHCGEKYGFSPIEIQNLLDILQGRRTIP
ncbi:Hsp33 family molecular chaperone HslO [Paenibacillus sp. Y412MC10]|uniref:Hsp33 family molecular chaperone HslO n=1 Tax=Geobacillus sp. (strain Y412MC10) TaxID=481743 RepID=UPI0016433A2A|nr:Hsp33 family molecular chaperone HslO [Paenibacillus sp. Y412MC10]